jgi:hypothetical protein
MKELCLRGLPAVCDHGDLAFAAHRSDERGYDAVVCRLTDTLVK